MATKKDKEMQAVFQSEFEKRQAQEAEGNAPIPLVPVNAQSNEGFASEAQATIESMDLYAFLPEAAAARVNERKVFPAPPNFKNPDGSRASIELRKLSYDEFSRINNKYRQNDVIRNKKGRIETTTAGRAAVLKEVDNDRLSDAVIAAALVFPNMKDQQLMNLYGAFNEEDLVRKIFNTGEDYAYMINLVLEYSGLGVKNEDENTEDMLVEQAKN